MDLGHCGVKLTLVTTLSLQHWTLLPVWTEQRDGSHHFCSHAQGTLGERDWIPHQSWWEGKGSCQAAADPPLTFP